MDHKGRTQEEAESLRDDGTEEDVEFQKKIVDKMWTY